MSFSPIPLFFPSFPWPVAGVRSGIWLAGTGAECQDAHGQIRIDWVVKLAECAKFRPHCLALHKKQLRLVLSLFISAFRVPVLYPNYKALESN